MNRLANETSPYLRQHRENPVDWYPWGDEAFAKARQLNRPVLLSVGYSACHWCHVMAHESFEDVETARLMNERFINIKVDREERPDLDQIYQPVAQAITQGGGWPLTVFLTPEGQPFFGGTYYPPTEQYGRPGFRRVLQAVSDAYHADPSSIQENAARLGEVIRSLDSVPHSAEAGDREIHIESIVAAGKKLLQHVDPEHGGLGTAPKFPNAGVFSFLWRIGNATGWADAKAATINTLRRMAEGGIYDQLGGGFHRYAVDHDWTIPHFEKMLYDNGILLKLYSEVILSGDGALTEDDREVFLKVLEQTSEYLLREMRAPEGGFFAAQDADSEGVEGKYFVWRAEQVDQLASEGGLSKTEAEVFKAWYGVDESEKGSVLVARQKWQDVAAQLHLTERQGKTALSSARSKLMTARSRRVAPGKDDKVLTGWNGLAISGLAWAGQALRLGGREEAARNAMQGAGRAYSFVLERLSMPGGKLYASYQNGGKFAAYLDDYGFMAMAALDLARFASGEAEITELTRTAAGWIDVVLKEFSDSRGAGYFFTDESAVGTKSLNAGPLIHRPKSIYDHALPAGTSVVLSCLVALSELQATSTRGRKFFEEQQRQLLELFPLAQHNPSGMGEFLSSALLSVAGAIVMSGPGAREVCRHPHVFRGAGANILQLCHKHSCVPLSDPAVAWQEAWSRTQFPQTTPA